MYLGCTIVVHIGIAQVTLPKANWDMILYHLNIQYLMYLGCTIVVHIGIAQVTLPKANWDMILYHLNIQFFTILSMW